MPPKPHFQSLIEGFTDEQLIQIAAHDRADYDPLMLELVDHAVIDRGLTLPDSGEEPLDEAAIQAEIQRRIELGEKGWQIRAELEKKGVQVEVTTKDAPVGSGEPIKKPGWILLLGGFIGLCGLGSILNAVSSESISAGSMILGGVMLGIAFVLVKKW